VLNEALGITQQELEDYLAGWNSLTLQVTPNTPIAADGVAEAVITCAGVMAFDCYIWKGNLVVQQQLGIADGEIVFSTDQAGLYVIEMRLANGSSGYIKVEAVRGIRMTVYFLLDGITYQHQTSPNTPLHFAVGMFLAQRFPRFQFPPEWGGLVDSDGDVLEPCQPVRELCDYSGVVIR